MIERQLTTHGASRVRLIAASLNSRMEKSESWCPETQQFGWSVSGEALADALA